jgi:hypothetical protein
MMVAKGNDCGKIEFASKYIDPAPWQNSQLSYPGGSQKKTRQEKKAKINIDHEYCEAIWASQALSGSSVFTGQGLLGLERPCSEQYRDLRSRYPRPDEF